VTPRRVILLVVAVVVAAGCTGNGEPSPVVESTSTSAVATVTTVIGPTSSAPRAPTVAEIKISVTGATVTGGGRHTVARGATVRITVTADVSDEVHLHGYDKKANVTPTAAAMIDLVANIPGIFEIELERRAKQLAQLEVTG
jgi:hypothetical protein